MLRNNSVARKYDRFQIIYYYNVVCCDVEHRNKKEKNEFVNVIILILWSTEYDRTCIVCVLKISWIDILFLSFPIPFLFRFNSFSLTELLKRKQLNIVQLWNFSIRFVLFFFFFLIRISSIWILHANFGISPIKCISKWLQFFK